MQHSYSIATALRSELTHSSARALARPIRFATSRPTGAFPRPLHTTTARTVSYKRFPNAGSEPSPSPTPGSSSGGGSGQKNGWKTGGKPWGAREQLGVLGLAGGGVYVVAHIEQVPETGRWRFIHTSDAYEAKMGKETFSQLNQEFSGRVLPPNHPTTQHVAAIVNRLLSNNNLGSLSIDSNPTRLQNAFGEMFGGERVLKPGEDIWDSGGTGDGNWASESRTKKREWHLFVVDDPKTANAMASYGNVVVFTGILPIARDADGLAAVIGHEIAHNLLYHSSEALSRNILLVVGAQLLDSAVGIDIGLSRLLGNYLLELPGSRTQELEADMVGLRLLAKAGYRPQAALDMFQRLGEEEKGQRFDVNWLYTHPTSKTRIEALKAQLRNAEDMQSQLHIESGDSSSGFV